MGFSLKKAVKLPSLKSAIKNPVKQLFKSDLLPIHTSISPLGFAGGAAVKHFKDKITQPLPEVPYFAEPRQIQDKLVSNQMSAADEYAKNLPQAINSEVGVERARIGEELNQAQRQARGSANARGMLFSGQRMAHEGALANEASSQVANARAKAIQRTLGQSQAMYAQPLQSRANIAETNMQQKGLLDNYKRETDQMRTNILNAGMQNVGAGIGMGLANGSAKPVAPKAGYGSAGGGYGGFGNYS